MGRGGGGELDQERGWLGKRVSLEKAFQREWHPR